MQAQQGAARGCSLVHCTDLRVVRAAHVGAAPLLQEMNLAIELRVGRRSCHEHALAGLREGGMDEWMGMDG